MNLRNRSLRLRTEKRKKREEALRAETDRLGLLGRSLSPLGLSFAFLSYWEFHGVKLLGLLSIPEKLKADGQP